MANTMINPVIYSKKFLRNFDLQTVMANLVSTTYQGDMAEAGDTLKAQKLPNVTYSTYTPGNDMSAQDVTITDNTIQVNQKKGALIYLDDMEIKQTHLPVINGMMKRFAYGASTVIDDRCLGHYADVDSGNILGSDANPISLTKDNIYGYACTAYEYLQNAGAMLDSLFMVVDPNTSTLIKQSPDYVKATQTGDMVVRNGEIANFAGFKVVVSPRLTAVSGVKNLMFFHPEFIELIIQIDAKRLMDQQKAEKRHGMFVKSGILYGSGVLQPTAGVVLKKAA
jgi:hypothetical protein